MAGFNRVQKQKEGTGMIYIRFRKTTNEEQMISYAKNHTLKFENLAKDYDAGIFHLLDQPAEVLSSENRIQRRCMELMRDYDNVFLAREHVEK